MADLAIKDGGVLIKDGALCLSCSCWPVHDPGPNDCCCFLDPSTLVWDSETTYAIGDLVKFGAPAKTYRSLANGNLNHVVADTDWWEIASNSVHCSNVGWDSISPFGGPGKTPYVYTINMRIVWRASAHETRLHFTLLKTYPQNRCHWVMPYPTPAVYCSDGQLYKLGRVMLRGSAPWWFSNYMVYIQTFNWSSGCNYANLAIGQYRMSAYLLRPTHLDYCELKHSAHYDHPDFDCAVRRVVLDEPPWDYEFGDIDLSYHPGHILEWDECADYEIGDMVAWNGVFYICIQAHSSGMPPACTGSKEPPNAAYWDVA